MDFFQFWYYIKFHGFIIVDLNYIKLEWNIRNTFGLGLAEYFSIRQLLAVVCTPKKEYFRD